MSKQLIKTLSVALSILLFVAGLTSCGNLLMKDIDTPLPSSRQTGSISGSYIVEGAVPSQFLNANRPISRTAFPELQYTSDEAYFEVEAIPTTAGYDSVYGTVNDTDFTITGLTLDIPYTIKARWISTGDESILLEGTASESVTLTSSSSTKAIGNIPLYPSQTASGTGDVYLCIDTSGVTKTSLNSINVTMKKVNGGEDPITYNDFDIDIEEVPSGAWKMDIDVYTKNAGDQDVLVFHCTEIVNVFDNLLTDLWVKNGNEAYLVGNSSGAEFKLTDACIEKFQKTTFYVDTSLTENGSGSYFSPFNSVATALDELPTNNPNVAKTLLIRGNGKNEEITIPFQPDYPFNLTIETYKANDQDSGKFTIVAKDDYAFYVDNGSTLNVSGLSFEGANGFVNGGDGGFFYIEDGTATFTNCTFTGGNTCGDGGAICNKGTLTLDTCTFTDNYSETHGGALASTGNNSSLTVKSCTFDRNKSDHKDDAIYIDGSLSLVGTNKFTDSERFEVTDNTSITLIGDTKFTGTESTDLIQIPLYWETLPSNVTFSNANSISKAKEFFCFYEPGYEINDDGKIVDPTTLVPKVSLSINGGSPQEYDSLNEAIDNIETSNSYVITLNNGGSYTLEESISLAGTTVAIVAADNGSATIKLSDSLTGQVPISLGENITFTANNINFEGSSYKGELAGLLYIQSDSTTAEFENCIFKDFKCIYVYGYYSSGVIYSQSGSLFLNHCTFTSNYSDWNSETETGKPNDIYLNNCELTLMKKNSFSSPLILYPDYYHNDPYIVIDETFEPSENKTEFILTGIEQDQTIITGSFEDYYSQFIFTMPEGYENYGISSDGKLIKDFYTSVPDVASLESYSTVTLRLEDLTSLNDFLNSDSLDDSININLDLSNVAPSEIKNINPELKHVETLILPTIPDDGTDGIEHLFGNDSGGYITGPVKKVVIKGDVTGLWIFQKCTSIEEVVFEEGVTTVNDGMFAGCTSLKTVSLPSTLKTIGFHAFADSAIESITIPASVTTIKHFAFYSTSQTSGSSYELNSVIFEDTSHTWSIRKDGTGAFYSMEGQDWDNISVDNSSTNAQYFRQDWGCSEAYWWVKNP